jgi:transposase InsO family protein
MKAVAAERRRFGYRRIHVMLERQGIVMNLKKLRRLYREEKLQVRRRGGRKRALGTRRPMLLPDAPNVRWSLDFVSDALTDGRRFRVLAVVDDYSRECLALVADTSLSGHRVVRELDAVIARRGRPAMVVSDNHCPAGDLQSKSAERGHGADLDGGPVMVSTERRRMALHRTGQAHAEWLRGELQRPPPR